MRGKVVTGGCYGSVLLDNELRRSLSAMHGRDVPWVHGCVLDHGHDGDHGAPADDVDGEPRRWFRWADAGPARIEAVDPSPPGRHSKARGAPPDPPPRPPTTAGAPATGSQAEALWAIAAAIERLADAVAGLEHRPPDGIG